MSLRENVAWAAGLFEGEGTITRHEARRRSQLALVSTDEDVVRRFAAIVGIGKVYGPYNWNGPHCKPHWR